MPLLDIGNVKQRHSWLLEQHDRIVTAALNDGGRAALDHIDKRPGFTPRTGRTQDATKARMMRTPGGKLMRISNRTKVARFMEHGTKPHPIEARRKPFLRFKYRGQWVSKKKVFHRGTRAYLFMRRGAITGYYDVGRTLRASMRSVAKQF